MSDRLVIRAERPEDAEAIFAVHAEAFPGEAEAHLVDRLREAARPLVSRVAVEGGRVVGHVMVSPVTVGEGEGALACGGLGPVGVLPARQGRGIGGALVREALSASRSLWPAIFLLGSPVWYARFGFVAAAPLGFEYAEGVHGPAFQVHLFGGTAPPGLSGRVRYHEAFGALG